MSLQQVKAIPVASITPQMAADLLLQRRRGQGQRSFREFVAEVNPRYEWYTHCNLLADLAERIVDDELKRVMIFLPPRHSKSETISRLLTAYYLYRHPERWVGLNSYAAELAYVLSRASRDNYTQITSGGVRNDAAAVKHWETGKGGGLWAAGVGGAITGKGYHLGVIDDPIKNYEEAQSDVIRERNKEWFRSTFYTRAEPNAAIVLIQTRWDENDIAGWLLSEEGAEGSENWHIVNLPAIAEDAPEYPAGCTLEPDWREDGEALCPERYPIDKLLKIKSRIGDYHFNCLYQQRPSAREGSFFQVSKLAIVDALPAHLRYVRGWDLAASEQKGDWTVGVKIGAADDGFFYVSDVVRGQWKSDERNRQKLQTAALDGHDCRIRLAQDPGQAGVDQAESLVRLLAGYPVTYERVTGAKETRADPLSSQVNAGNVRLLAGDWNRAFIEELRQFPTGKNDDQVDAASDSFNELTRVPEFIWV